MASFELVLPELVTVGYIEVKVRLNRPLKKNEEGLVFEIEPLAGSTSLIDAVPIRRVLSWTCMSKDDPFSGGVRLASNTFFDSPCRRFRIVVRGSVADPMDAKSFKMEASASAGHGDVKLSKSTSLAENNVTPVVAVLGKDCDNGCHVVLSQ